MPPNNPAVTPEPAPQRTDSPAVWPLVIEDSMGSRYAALIPDMLARDSMGRQKYGTALQVENGRNPLADAYQEALDAIAYTRQAYEKHRTGLLWMVHEKALDLAMAIRAELIRERGE